MQNFNIVKNISVESTFRVMAIEGMFDLQKENNKGKIETTSEFNGEINIPEEWSIGLIVGASGTGKTTIAKELFLNAYFDGYSYSEQSVLDNMPETCSIQEIITAFSSVGFNSPPSWLKPYFILSNGEKMRVDLTRCLLSSNELIVFDEFTSVVDRQVAKIGSFAVQKAVRNSKKKFIALSCHYDVEEWLMPDWVFDTNEMKFISTRRYLRRPEITFDIREVSDKTKYWNLFKKYHYLSHYHNNAARVFVAFLNEKPIGYISVFHFPNRIVVNFKKVHRLVVMPDYQGVGIATNLLNEIARYYVENDFRMLITTSSPSLIYALAKDKKWRCKAKGRATEVSAGTLTNGYKGISNRLTSSWEYNGK